MSFSERYRSSPTCAHPALATLVDHVVEEMARTFPFAATSLGLHAWDGELGDYSAPALSGAERRWEDLRRRLLAVDPAGLSPSDRADRAVALGQVESVLLELGELRSLERDPTGYNTIVMSAVLGVIRRDYAPLPERVEFLISRLAQVPGLMAQARANLTRPLALPTRLARLELPAARRFLEELPDGAAAGAAPDLRRRLAEAAQAAASAYAAMEGFLEELEAQARTDHALGEATFRRLLRAQEGVERSPAELLRRGEEELRRLRERLHEAAQAVAPGASPQEAVRLLGKDHPPAPQVMAEARRTLEELAEFSRQWVTVPAAPQPAVVETPPFMRQTTLASLDPPGPFEDRATEAFYQITLPDPSLSPEEVEQHLADLSRPLLRIISVHEVYPGHYLQFLHLRRFGTRMRRAAMSTAFVEGWAHYMEEFAVEHGLGAGDPRLRLAQTVEALTRVGRYLASVRIHCEGMPWEAAMREIFIDQCYLEPVAARREAMRGVLDPMYLNYTLGKLEIIALRDELLRRGSVHSVKEFHDRFLSQGAPPIPVLGQLMQEHG